MLLDIDTKHSPDYYSSGTQDEQLLLIQQLREELEESRSKEGGVLVVPPGATSEEWVERARVLRDKMLHENGEINKDYRPE